MKNFFKKVATLILAILLLISIAVYLSMAAEKAKDGHFTAYDNGTVLDTKTNLLWSDKDNGKMIPWPYAKTYCDNYRRGGYKDWRMPTLEELETLYDKSKSYSSDCDEGANVHLTELIRLRCGWVWSSETTVGKEAFFFVFYNGKDGRSDQMDIGFNFRVICVRNNK